MALPAPAADALAHSQQLQALISSEITHSGGWISFARFMELALYAPGLGYYSGGARKFGAAGDFVTAPEMSALFGQALATQVGELMARSAAAIVEVGAGTGRLAADLLAALAAAGTPPEHYAILELSGELRERQRQTLARAVPELLPRVRWLDALPDTFAGVVVGNEVLDAMPVHLIDWHPDGAAERGVGLDPGGGFCWRTRPAEGAVRDAAARLAEECGLAAGFTVEINLAARAWLGEWGRRLSRGALLLLDYGFPRREYYHPQRSDGTLMCHYRHHAHDDPFFLPGLQDITAHVDFTAVAEAAHEAGLELLGYTSQAQFLLNCGLLERLPKVDPARPEYIRAAAAAQKLISPAEMGELFKVIAAGRGVSTPLAGFARGDRLYRL